MLLLTEKKSGAITLIAVGLIILFNVPGWFLANVAAPPDQRAEFAQKIASVEAGEMTTEIVGGVMLTTGLLVGWRAWARPE